MHTRDCFDQRNVTYSRNSDFYNVINTENVFNVKWSYSIWPMVDTQPASKVSIKADLDAKHQCVLVVYP